MKTDANHESRGVGLNAEASAMASTPTFQRRGSMTTPPMACPIRRGLPGNRRLPRGEWRFESDPSRRAAATAFGVRTPADNRGPHGRVCR